MSFLTDKLRFFLLTVAGDNFLPPFYIVFVAKLSCD